MQADTPEDTRDLLRFLPTVLTEQLHKHARSANRKWREGKEPIAAAFLFVDIFGLHHLSQALPTESTDGQAATEQRRQAVLDSLVAAFDRLVGIARRHAGDVVKFTGDGMLIVWPFARSGPQRPEQARRAVISACRCALDLQIEISGTPLMADATGAPSSSPTSMRNSGGASGGGTSARAAERSEREKKEAEREEREAQKKLARLRECRDQEDATGFDTLNQGGLILLSEKEESRAIDVIGSSGLVAASREGNSTTVRHNMSLAAGVGVGDLFAMHVGSPQRWEYVVWGEPYAEIVRSVQCHARPGDVLASQDVLSLAPDAIGLSADAAVPLPNSLLLLKTVDSSAVGVDVDKEHERADQIAWSVVGNGVDKEQHTQARQEVLPYVAGSERAVISKGGVSAARNHRAALECTVMVIKIVADYRNASSVMRTTEAVRLIQKVLYQHEAAFKHFVQMGHGGLAVTGFGLPPFTLKPASCARRAVAAGCAVRAKLAQIGVFCTVGISAGPVCIGCLPSAERIEYALIGRPVALAIQMANACTARRPLLIDDICFQASKTTYNCEPLRAVLHSGGDGNLSCRIVMLFSLVSTKPITQERREGQQPHDVTQWLRSRGLQQHQRQAESLLSAVAIRELRECFDGLSAGGDSIGLPQLRAALKETKLFSEATLVNALFARMDTDGSGRVSWPEFLEAIQAFDAESNTNNDADEEQGSGTLGENIRLLLLAYGHRRHLQRQLGESFSAKYYAGPLGNQTASSRSGRRDGETHAIHRVSAPLRQRSIDIHEAEAIAEDATDMNLINKDGTINFVEMSSMKRRSVTKDERHTRGGRRVSIAPMREGSFSKRGSATSTAGAPSASGPKMLQRRPSFHKAMSKGNAGRGATPSKNELTTDEILFSRRGSGLLTTLASAGGGNDAPGGGGSNKGRDWSGLPEEVALAILDDESERKKESLLSILEESSAKFAQYLETRPEGWGVRDAIAEREAAAEEAKRRNELLAEDLKSSYLVGDGAVSSGNKQARPGTATRLVAPGKQVGVQAGRRQASDAASVFVQPDQRHTFGEERLTMAAANSPRRFVFATSCGSTTSESIRQPNYSYWNGDASAMQAERAAAAAALLEPPPPPAVNPLDHPTLNDLLADSEDEEEEEGMIASNTQEFDTLYGGESSGAEDALTSLTPSPPPFKPEASSVSRFERPSTATATIALLPAAANAPVKPPSRVQSARPRPNSASSLVPLATVLAMLSDISTSSSDLETLEVAKRARQHAFMQQRQFGGVRGELSAAVQAVLSRVLREEGGGDRPASAAQEAPAAPPPPRSPLWSHAPPPQRPHTAMGRTAQAPLSARPPSSRGAPPSARVRNIQSARGARGPSVLLATSDPRRPPSAALRETLVKPGVVQLVGPP